MKRQVTFPLYVLADSWDFEDPINLFLGQGWEFELRFGSTYVAENVYVLWDVYSDSLVCIFSYILRT